MLDRQKVQRIAFEQMALSRCPSRHGCILCQQVHHTDALLILDMLYMLVLSNPRSAAQPQVVSRKTTTAAEAGKIPVLGVSGAVWRPQAYGLIDRRYDRNLLPNAKCGNLLASPKPQVAWDSGWWSAAGTRWFWQRSEGKCAMRRDELIQEYTHRVADDEGRGGLAALLANRDGYANFDAKAKKQNVKRIDIARRTGRNELVLKTKLLPRGEGEAFLSADV